MKWNFHLFLEEGVTVSIRNSPFVFDEIPLEIWINIARSTTIRGVAGHILERALLFAAWADIGWGRYLNGIPAPQAFPERIHVSGFSCLCVFGHDFSI